MQEGAEQVESVSVTMSFYHSKTFFFLNERLLTLPREKRFNSCKEKSKCLDLKYNIHIKTVHPFPF